MKTKLLLLSFLILLFSCSRDDEPQEETPVTIEDNFTGVVNLTNLSSTNIEILSEADQSNVNTDGKFSIYKHSVVVAKNKSLDKPVYFGLPNADQNANYQLNAKETALYFAMASIPNIRRPYYKPYLQKIKQALYQVPEVQTLETKINQSIAQYGYLNYDFVGTELGNAVDKIIQNMNFEKSSYTVNQRATWNPNYSAGKGFYRCDTIKPAGWTDTYETSTQTYRLKRKMYNSTAAVVGVQIGKFNENTQSATLSNNYVGFIEPYYPPSLTSLDGTISNFNQTMEAFSDLVNNGVSGLANTDAYSKDNEFIFEAKQNSKDAIIFVNGALDNKMIGLNVAYLFIDNFQDIFEDISGNNFLSTDNFVNKYLGKLITDNASATHLANYSTWFIDKNYQLIIDDLESNMVSFVENNADIVVPYKDALKGGISKSFKFIAGSYVAIYEKSQLAYKIASVIPLSSSPKFSAAIPINFSNLDLPPSPVNPVPFNSSMPVTSSINFTWGVTGYTNQTLTYNVYFSSNINELYSTTKLIATSIGNSYFLKNFSSQLPENRYYWQVEVVNQNGMKTLGPVWSFDVGNYPFKPSVGTINPSSVNNNSASVGGIIHNNGGSPVLQKGVCYSTTPNPTLSNNFTNNGSGDNLFTTTLSNLQQGTTYYVRAYATNSKGTGYGEEYNFTTTGSSSGNNTVTIGTQIWQAKNLDVSTYSDGTPIPQITDPTAWANATTGAWCYYNNDPANGTIYGKLYNWYAVAGIYDTASANNPALRKKLAPIGWHISTSNEWQTLFNSLGGQLIAGGKLKEIGTNHWLNPNTGATNSSNFTALPSGRRQLNGNYQLIGNQGEWWTDYETSVNSGYAFYIVYNDIIVNISNPAKKMGLSVRCVKD